MKVFFKESQKFNQWWVWLLVLGAMGAAILAGFLSWQTANSLTPLIVSALAGAIGPIVLALLELQTRITIDGIEVKFWPFGRRRIFRSEIAEARVREYAPLKEYGGWGYRTSKQGKAYNMYGKYGLQLRLKNGERILIGTQRPEELAELMDIYLDEGIEMEQLELEELRKEKLKNRS
ncbi:MAG: hypothetical protein AAFY41_18570 [Bacteroidota bacterium]